MDTIIDSGVARNAINRTDGKDLAVDPGERRFVTYTNALGAVHTIIVDVEHIAKDGEALLRWFDHTRATITHKSGSSGTDAALTPAEVLSAADSFLESVGGAKSTDNTTSGGDTSGGA